MISVFVARGASSVLCVQSLEEGRAAKHGTLSVRVARTLAFRVVGTLDFPGLGKIRLHSEWAPRLKKEGKSEGRACCTGRFNCLVREVSRRKVNRKLRYARETEEQQHCKEKRKSLSVRVAVILTFGAVGTLDVPGLGKIRLHLDWASRLREEGKFDERVCCA